MAAGSISAPTVIPLRIPTSFSQSKLCIDTDTPIELSSSSPSVKIFYTLNGTKPNPFERDFKKSSTFPYTAPFTLCIGKHTIKTLAIAFDKQDRAVDFTVKSNRENSRHHHHQRLKKQLLEPKPVSQEILQVAKPSV